MLSQTQKSIHKEYQILIQKQIVKPRQKNQFTKDNKFIKKYQAKRQNYRKTNFVVVQLRIPQTLPANNVFRLPSNIQFPRNARNSDTLGNLNVEFYSYNYKINRIDRSYNITSITYDPIDRPYIPLDIVQEMLQQNDERLFNSFNELNAKKLDKQNFIYFTKEQLQELENSIINKAFIGIISKVDEGKIVTLHRVVSDQYLACLGIDYEMLTHFGQENGTIPIPFFFSESDYSSQHLSNFFLLNTLNKKDHEMQATNYRGENFPAKILFNNFHFYDEDDKCLYEYLYFVWEVDKRWCSKQKVLENHQDYFNLKDLPTSTSLSITGILKPEATMRCGFKQIGSKNQFPDI